MIDLKIIYVILIIFLLTIYFIYNKFSNRNNNLIIKNLSSNSKFKFNEKCNLK